MENELKELPAKWCILRTPDNARTVNMYFNYLAKSVNYKSHDTWVYSEVVGGTDEYPTYVVDGGDKDYRKPKILGFTPITFQQFEHWVLSKEIPKPAKEQRKIKGYLAPYDLFGDHVKAGHLFIRFNEYYYCASNIPPQWKLPSEIVETWEPVYKNEFPKFGSYSGKLVDGGLRIKYGCQEYEVQDIKTIESLMEKYSIYNFFIQHEHITYSITRSDIEKLVKVLNS